MNQCFSNAYIYSGVSSSTTKLICSKFKSLLQKSRAQTLQNLIDVFLHCKTVKMAILEHAWR